MAPAPPAFKTYSRKHVQNRRNSSVDVFDALLAENISKRKQAAHTRPRRRKKQIIIKELPPPDENHHLMEDSICKTWGLDDTFDRLRKEPIYNDIKPVFMTASNRSTSNRILITDTVHSPIIHNTRGYKKRVDSSTESSQNNTTTNKKKVRTLDKSVNESLFIEKVPEFVKPKEISLLSSPSILKSDGSVPPQMRSVANCSDADVSYEPLFSRTFKETVGAKMHIASTPAVASSTPCISTPIINETMSPILNNTQPKSLMESYEEIQNWNFKPPDFELDVLCCNDTPKIKKKKQLRPKKLQKKKDIIKNKIVNEKVVSAMFEQTESRPKVYRAKPDWKLKGEAKVVLDKCLDVIGIEKSVKFGNLDEPTLGFLPSPEDGLKNSLVLLSVFEESFKKICAQQNIEVEDANCISDIQSPVRYIALRKRKVAVRPKTKPKTEKTDIELITRRQNKSSTNSRELDINNKSVHSQLQRRNSNQSNSSLPQEERNVNLKLKCSQNSDSKQHNSSETCTFQESKFDKYQESIQNLIGTINDTSAIDSQESSINYEPSDKLDMELSSPVSRNLMEKARKFETSVTQESKLGEYQESIQNSIGKISDTSAIDLQESSINYVPSDKLDMELSSPVSRNLKEKARKFETSVTQESKLGEYQESIQNSIGKISDISAVDSQNSSINREPSDSQESFINHEPSDNFVVELSSRDSRNLKDTSLNASKHGTILESLLTNNNKTGKLSTVTENFTDPTSNELSLIDDFNRLGSISLQSQIELEVVNKDEFKNIEEAPEIISNKMRSPDVIPSTPPARLIKHKENYKRTLAVSLFEITPDSSKIVERCLTQTQNDLKEQSMEGNVDIRIRNTSSKAKDDSGDMSIVSINSESGVCDEADLKYKVTESIFEDSAAKFQESSRNYFKQENSYFDNHNSILEYHNYSKVRRYLNSTEVIEVSSSEEENSSEEEENSSEKNANENMKNASPKSNACSISAKSINSDKNHLSECETEITQKRDISSKSHSSFSSTTANCSSKNNTSENYNSNGSSKLDNQHSTIAHSNESASANDSDEELDFSEFIASNEESNIEVAHEEVIENAICPSTESTDLPITTIAEAPKAPCMKPAPLFLKPGKMWRRSLLTVRKSFIICDPIVCKANTGCICTCAKCRQNNSATPNKWSRRLSIKVIPESPHRSIQHETSVLENYASSNITYGSNTIQDSVYREKSIGEPLLVRNNSIHESLPVINPSVTARDIVLRRCGQAEPISFTECYPSLVLKNCFKIGEGVYGEVFLFKNPDGGSRVMKVIPIEGAQMVNGEHQKKFEEILSEIVIAMELSNLRSDKKNRTDGFSKVEKIRCVRGRYPDRLLELWELFDESRGSENDSPEIFRDDQLYIVLELVNGGQDMEAFAFNNASQALTLFKQIACALAVAESALQFEHRDLHWGNVLISQTDKNKKLTYCLNGKEFTIPACGIEVSIIDFTLSRITCDGVCIFNDLSADPDLFDAEGDYQFEVYKLMQKRNNNEWQPFEPYSNVLWLHYVLDKMATALRYKNTNSIVHRDGISKIKQFKSRILKYSSVKDMVNNEFLS